MIACSRFDAEIVAGKNEGSEYMLGLYYPKGKM